MFTDGDTEKTRVYIRDRDYEARYLAALEEEKMIRRRKEMLLMTEMVDV